MRIEFFTQQNYQKVSPYIGTERARKLLLHKKALVLYEKGKYVGVVSSHDLVKNNHNLIIDCYTEKPTIDYTCDVIEALDIMRNNDIEVLPVQKGNILFGLIFKNDLLEYLKENTIELEAKVHERTIQLEKAKIKAQEGEKLKSAFLANLSHEIRTPLNGILGFSEILISKELPEDKLQTYLKIINQSCRQLFTMLNDVLLMSKLETKQLEFRQKEVKLNVLMNQLFDFYEPLTQEKSVELKLVKEFTNIEKVILADEVKLQQVLNNLLNNAIKFTLQGSIEFGYGLLDNKLLRFYVKDTGIGIKPIFHEKIFDRFHQVEQTDFINPSGMGLGLSICKGIVEGMGGEIGLQSTIGAGSEFYFSIPYHLVESEQIDISENKPKSITDVLIVDDEPANLIFLEELLSTYSTFKIHKASNGQEAVDYCLQNSKIKLVFMDLRMPVMNGDEATRRIKQINSDIIVIVQSAYTSNDDLKKALDAGCDDYISKPINTNKINDLINNIIINKNR